MIESQASASDGTAIAFGPFRLLSAQRVLLEGDKPVRLGSRAFDILTALVERAGEVVGKEELIALVWPTAVVEEANLKIQISALRRALGDGQGDNRYVATVVGRGYNFVATIRKEKPSRSSPSPIIAPVVPHNLPFATTRMIGREETVTALVARLSHQRLVTIVGPGGIGKTTAALAVAEQLIADYEHGVWLVDLTPLGDQHLVPSAVATVLGLEIRADDQLSGLVTRLKDKRMLLVLDNCEHVIEAAASLAAAILSGAPGVSLLATSRERLGIIGEREYRLGPLSSPKPSSKLTIAETATFPAVQLFVERVSAIVEDFELTDANAPLVIEICRKLDGLPLAIEFAAPCVEALGVQGLADRLNDSLPMVTVERRTSTARHQTMRAVIDWSYRLLSEEVRPGFRALGIFAGCFTAQAATAVATRAGTASIDAIDLLAGLVAKSLVVADVSGTTPRFRLLETTRAYALEKLDASGERERISFRHAEYYRNLFERAESEARARPASEWLADYALDIDNLRMALDWAFSSSGDRSVGVALTAAAVPLWMQLSLLEECRGRAEQALGALETSGTQDRRQEMRLQAALGASTPEVPEMGAAFTKALDIAETLGDTEYQSRALHGLYFYHYGSGRHDAALQSAQRLHNLEMSGLGPSNRLDSERMMGATEHTLGDQTSARRHLEGALTHYAVTDRGRDVSRLQDVIRFGTDLRVSVRAILARVLWLQGFPDQAARTAEMSVEEAQATGHALTLCWALALAACPISLWAGNLVAAAHYAEMLLDHSRRHSLPLLGAFGFRFQKVVALKNGDSGPGSWLQDSSLEEIAKPDRSFRFLAGLSELTEALAQAGRITDALALVEAGIEHSAAGWLMPELLRVRGEIFLLQSSHAAADRAEDLFRHSLDAARCQAALSWELRAATSLTRLLLKRGHSDDVVAVLQPIYCRFTEGFGTADLIAAKQLLDDLRRTGYR